MKVFLFSNIISSSLQLYLQINFVTNYVNIPRCLINGGVKINKGGGVGWSEIFVKFNKRGRNQNKRWVGFSKNPLILVMNEKRDINVYY